VVAFGTGMTRLLNRLSIDPSLRQAHLAKALDFSRSAVNQLWKKLETYHKFRIRSNLDYGRLGFHYMYGWGKSGSDRDAMTRFEAWLTRNPFTLSIARSLMTSKMDRRIFFQVLVPSRVHFGDYITSLERFKKKPYDLDILYDSALTIADQLNFGYYGDEGWEFESEYRFQASFTAAKSYASILPASQAIKQSSLSDCDTIQSLIAASLETDYFTTSAQVREYSHKFGVQVQSERTLRRKISTLRKTIAYPYIEMDNIGLPQTVVITLEEPKSADIYKVLLAQSSLFPQVRVLSGAQSLVLIIKIPEQTPWIHISTAMSHIVDSSSEICTFIAENPPARRWLMDVIEHMKAPQE
jgi:DNA-binding Lrp family transcriptional regulator